jgi:dienelactone hydrolase
MTVSPTAALMDEPVTVTSQGLAAGTDVTINATAIDSAGVRWTACAVFAVPKSGVVSLKSPSIGGSYNGVNPMGLFELMAPPVTASSDIVFIAPKAGYPITLTTVVAGRVVATATARRDNPQSREHVSSLSLTADGVIGQLYLPSQSSGRHAGVLVFGGSEGGLAASVQLEAQLLAAHGYPSLALAYFGKPGLPSTLSAIPLEYFTRALEILRRQPGVDPLHVLVEGDSRGSEAALLLGADFPTLVNGVIAGSPSSVANPSYPIGQSAAWTRDGTPVPTVPAADLGVADPPDAQAAVIPVENIQGPILLACGQQDRIWNSCGYAQAIAARLDAHDFGPPIALLSYPQAGHLIGTMTAYYSATTAAFAADGGIAAGNLSALGAAHSQLLTFLAQQ